MSNQQTSKMSNKPKSNIASKIPTSGRDSGTHSRSSSVSNLTTASDLHSEIGDVASDNAEDFKIDERVWVNGTKPGCIKFIGKTQFAPGIWAGVLLDEPVGKNDGSVAGVKYFTCEPLRGIFARPSKLTRTAGAVSGIGDSVMIGTMSTPPKLTNVPSSGASVNSNISSSSSKYTKLKVGDRITVSSLSGLKSGTLRFIGVTDFAKGEWAGIELDEPTGKNDGSVAGKRYFTCELKYGLFAPLHKVSRPGATPISRPGSVRGTPLLRSNSRDSLNSSVSNSSRASRVKLGITSLTSAQKARISGGIGITNTTKAFEEAIKEKDQHIEQLLKERELDRAEFARLANHFEQIGAKSVELEKKQKLEESEKKSLEEQLTTLQKKFEDIQFQLEEEKIIKADFEMQLRQRSKILAKIEEYISKESGENFLNIKAILLGQETLTEIEGTQKAFEDSSDLQKKITELEATVKLLSKEKNEILSQLMELQKCTVENSGNESQITSLNMIIQEKDDMITNLKNELNSSIEKVSQLIEDNKNLNEQMLLKEEQAKGHADDVIKELGEKINSLSEQLKTQSSQLAEHVTTVEDKNNKIRTLEHSLKDHADAFLKLQNEHKCISDTLKLKESECEEKIAAQKFLEETVITLKSEVETHNIENQKKINLLEEEIKTKSGLLNNYLSSIEEKENLISSLQQNFDSQASFLLQLQNEKKDLNDSFNLKEVELGEKAAKVKFLEEKIAALTVQNESNSSEMKKKMLDLVKQIEMLTNSVQEKEDQLLKTQGELRTSQSTIQTLDETVQQLSEKIQQSDFNLMATSKEATEKISNFENKLSVLMQEKSEYEKVLADYSKQIENLKKSLDKSNLNFENSTKELQLLQTSFNEKDQEINQLTSKLQLAEQKVEMLNKDSSDHVMALQNELSKMREESTTAKIELEQELSKIKNENEKLTVVMKEKDASLLEKDEIVTSLEERVKEQDSKISDLSALNRDALENLSKCNADIEKAKKQEEEISKTLSEYETKLSENEQELLNNKNSYEKLLNTIKQKNDNLSEKEEIITSLQNKLKDAKAEISDLSAKNADLLNNISNFSMDIEERQKILNEKFSSSTVEFENKLKEKDQNIQDIQNELKKYIELLENKTKELNTKHDEVNVLKNVILEKESQFDELSKMIDYSQNQLTLLKEKNEKNESLLQSKESFIADFKTEQEKQLHLKEQSFKEETLKLENLITSKNEEISSNESQISNLIKDIEDKKKLIDSLFSELETAKADKQNSNNIYQELNDKIVEMEEKYSKLLEEKEKIANEELDTKDAKKNLEIMRDTLLQEKSVQEEIVKDREAKLQALQAEVNRMQTEFSQHKQELQQKLDVSEMELQAALELKNQLDLQHSVIEELQQELQKSDEKCKSLELQVQTISVITSEKKQLQAQVDEFQKVNKEKSEIITKLEEKNMTLEEQLNNNKNLILQKEKELSLLKEQLQKLPDDKVLPDLSLKSLEDENLALKNEIAHLELEKKSDSSTKVSTKELSSEEVEEKESLLSQIDFLNSIIVDLKQKNEKLTELLDAQTTCWEESDVNLNETKKAIAPRLFCDICEVFDLHETDDCPKQESFADETVPQLRRAGTKQLEERPYCNNCEMFGHWTLDCEEPETF